MNRELSPETDASSGQQGTHGAWDELGSAVPFERDNETAEGSSEQDNPPQFLYRGINLTYNDLHSFQLLGDQLVPPHSPKIDEQGREVIGDGNEYGLYMSDNESMVDYAYSRPRTGGFVLTSDSQRVELGIQKTAIELPGIGIKYRIDTGGLKIKKPWISDSLKGHYNNGMSGNEWITDAVPADHYEIASMQIGSDFLHDPEQLDVEDVAMADVAMRQRMEERKRHLELCVAAIEKNFPDASARRAIDKPTEQVLKEIFGDHGAAYTSFEEIPIENIQDLLNATFAKVYQSSPEEIDFKSLKYIDALKQRARSQDEGLSQIIEEDLTQNQQKKEDFVRRKSSESKTTFFDNREQIIREVYNTIKDIAKGDKMSEHLRTIENNTEAISGGQETGWDALQSVEFAEQSAEQSPDRETSTKGELPQLKSEHLEVLRSQMVQPKKIEDLSPEDATKEYLDLLLDLSANFTSDEGRMSGVVERDRDGKIARLDRRGYSGDEKFARELIKGAGLEVEEGANTRDYTSEDFHYNDKYLDRAHTLRMVDSILGSEQQWRTAGQDYEKAQAGLAGAEDALSKFQEDDSKKNIFTKIFTFGKRRNERKQLEANVVNMQASLNRAELSSQHANRGLQQGLNSAYSADYGYGHHKMSYAHEHDATYQDETNQEYNGTFFGKDDPERQAKVERALALREKLYSQK